MTASTLRLIGALFVLIGAIKVWTHSQSAGLLSVPTCFGGDALIRVDMPLWHQVHCWGCYVALAGFAALALPDVWKRAQRAF